MKELSVEEKAKRYDEALKVLHKYDGANIMFSQSLKEEMFPELCELEDEKTKKEIINYLECQSRDEPSRKDTHNKWISYIEKYALSKDDYGSLRDCARILKTFGWQSYADRLTALCPALGEEAKAMMSTPIIFDESEDERIRKVLLNDFKNNCSEYYCEGVNRDMIIAWLEKQGNLMKALQISNAKIGELIEKNYYLKEQLEKQGEQKPAWSEEDELKIDFISKLILGLDQEKYDSQCMKELADWLKSLKERVQPQKR